MYNPQLETFIVVAEVGSFNKAAEKLFISPPAVIKQINALERDLDVQLFRRTHRGLILTAAGHSMLQDARYVIQYCKDSVTRAKNAMQEDENIIRIGSIGGLDASLNLGDVILAQGASTDSNYGSQYGLGGTFAPICDYGLLKLADQTAEKKGLPVRVGNVLASDMFYRANPEVFDKWRAMGILGVEMECSALYMNAAYLHKKALGILTVSDIIGDDSRAMTAEERQTTLTNMITLALDMAKEL